MRSYIPKLVTLAILISAFLSAVFGQSDLKFNGRVIDSNGAAIPGAAVTVTRDDIRYRIQSSTDESGDFSFSGLLPGDYSVSIAGGSFAASNRTISLPLRDEFVVTLVPEPVAAEISVTSSLLAGTNESLDEIPGAVERLDSHILESSRVFNFSEALRKISGVNVRDEEGFGLRPNIGIRGTNPTRSSKVLLLEDGIPLTFAPYGDNASYYHPPIERYKSVEVMKGSSQIAFGPQTIAGAINYVTPNPTEKPTFGIRLLGGNRSFFNGGVTGSGTIGKTGIYAGFTRKQGDGARENVSSKLNDFTTKVVQTLNDRNALTLKFSYYGEDSNVAYSGLTEAEYAAGQRSNPFKNDFFYGDRYGFSASHSAVLNPKAVLTTNFYYNKFRRHWWRQASTSDHRPFRLNSDPDCLSMADLSTTCGNLGNLREYDTIGVEPRFTFSYNAGSRFRGELQTGFRIHWESQDRTQKLGDLPNSRDGIVTERNIRRNLAYSGFVQNRFVFGDIAITPGVRFERIKLFRENRLTSPFSVGESVVTELIPGIGVAYSGIPKLTIFAGVHRGFSPPRVEDVISNSGGIVELDPERSWNYEVGVRSTPTRGTRIEATYFRLDYQNQIVPASIAGGVGATLTNGGETLQQGMEFSGQIDSAPLFLSSHNVYFRTAITWLPTAEFRGTRYSSTTASAVLNTYCPAAQRISATQCLIEGNRLPYVPETLVTSTFGYSHTNGLDAFVENVYISKQFGDDLNAVAPSANGQRGLLGAQSYWNATVNYKVERLRSTFFVTAKNLFDKTYIVDRARGILPSGPRLLQAGVNINF